MFKMQEAIRLLRIKMTSKRRDALPVSRSFAYNYIKRLMERRNKNILFAGQIKHRRYKAVLNFLFVQKFQVIH